MSTQTAVDDARWWRPRHVPREHSLRCGMGPLTLELQRGREEWRVAWSYGEESGAGSAARIDLHRGPLAAPQHERYAFRNPSGRISLRPLLADRAVVVRPRHSVFLPGGEETTLYLSSPLYVLVQVGDPPVTLRELPMSPLPETWFGPNTREGELCYAGRTRASHTAAEVPRRVHRALTPVHIRNDALAPLPLDKFSLPVPVLSVYGAPDGSLWTQSLSLIRTNHSDMASMRVDRQPPPHTEDLELLSGPRREHERGALVRAFDVLFRNGV